MIITDNLKSLETSSKQKIISLFPKLIKPLSNILKPFSSDVSTKNYKHLSGMKNIILKAKITIEAHRDTHVAQPK